jgi:hypothetical protein
MSDARYTQIKGDFYYDSKDKVIAKKVGERFVFVRHDRRSKSAPVKEGKRSEDRISRNYLLVQGTLYFDKHTNQLYKRSGNNFVLYTKDRRKQRRAVTLERRGSKA